MRYVEVKLLEAQEKTAYRNYVTESLRCITNNTARFAGGYEIKKSFSELLKPQKEDKRTGEEVITQMKEKLRKLGEEV